MLAHLTARGRHVFIHALAGEHIGTYLQTIITGDKQLPQTAQAHTHTHMQAAQNKQATYAVTKKNTSSEGAYNTQTNTHILSGHE